MGWYTSGASWARRVPGGSGTSSPLPLHGGPLLLLRLLLPDTVFSATLTEPLAGPRSGMTSTASPVGRRTAAHSPRTSPGGSGFSCDTCRKAFTSQATLANHNRSQKHLAALAKARSSITPVRDGRVVVGGCMVACGILLPHDLANPLHPRTHPRLTHTHARTHARQP